MCEICNGKSYRQVVAETKIAVARHGWSMIMVEGDLASPAYGYTVGLTEQRHPELLITGRTDSEMADLLTMLTHMVLDHGDELTAGLTLELPKRNVYLAPMEQPRDVLLMAAKIYSWRVQALQAVWADDAGQFPWEQRPPDVLTQPLYGTPPFNWPAQRLQG
ncbi:MAG TPA: DUF4262 domain-containing protein [Arthrobacter sp.]|nr:DUF4262 domain-containing protein [Arthrobacter sp.]